MKKWILLILVVIIWGAIVVKVLKKFRSTPDVINQIVNEKGVSHSGDKRDSLILNYEDPFRLAVPVKVKYSNPKPKLNSAKKSKVTWPIIEFHGLIDGKSEIALLSINNSQYLAQNNQLIDSIKVIGFNSQKITLLKAGEIKIIGRL